MEPILGVIVRVPESALDPANTGIVGVILSILVILTFIRFARAIFGAIFGR